MNTAGTAGGERDVVVIGVGNEFRRDDGVGAAVITLLAACHPPGVRLARCDGEPTQLFDAWAGARLAVVVDAVRCEPATPGRIHRTGLAAPVGTAAAGTHALGIPDAVRLAEVLDRAPQRLVVYAVEADDVGFGVGLTAAVEAAVPDVVRAILAETRAILDDTAALPG